MKEHRGTLVLVLGILGLVFCPICGIVAWIMGKNDLAEMDAGVMDPEGRGNTNAGKICGMIATILMAIGILFYVVLFVILGVGMAAAGAAGSGGM